jgi:hypothetical protein
MWVQNLLLVTAHHLLLSLCKRISVLHHHDCMATHSSMYERCGVLPLLRTLRSYDNLSRH